MSNSITDQLTPVQKAGAYWLKRDDLFEIAGVNGGKARTCWALAQGATGLVTAGARSSPQANIVAHVAAELGIPCRVHMPTGELSEQGLLAQSVGAEIVQHKGGYNNVLIERARTDARRAGWREIPFGMECREAVKQTSHQTVNLYGATGFTRIVVPVGSGMSLAGILHGLQTAAINVPVIGVVMGASPIKRFNKFAPFNWRHMIGRTRAKLEYNQSVRDNVLEGVELDAIYEAKCITFLQPGDLLWVVGIRNKMDAKAP